MKNQNKIMACVDRSRFADYVTDYAAWAAKSMHAPLELLHILESHPETSTSEDYSGAIGFDAQEGLLSSLSLEDASRNKIAREKGRIFLNQLRVRAVDRGVTAADVRQRHGNLVETLVEQAAHVQLVVLGRRGESADQSQRQLGQHTEEVVRQLKQPILTVTEGFIEPKNIMIAFDGGAVARKGIELIATSPLFKGLTVNVLMFGKENRETVKQLDWAEKKLVAAQFKPLIFLIPGEAKNITAKFIQDHGIDLMVIGAYSHSPLHSFLFGSKTADLLHAATIPILLLR